MTGIAALIGAPVRILTSTILAEYGCRTALAPMGSSINGILLKALSIVIGLFIYEVIVIPMGPLRPEPGRPAPPSF